VVSKESASDRTYLNRIFEWLLVTVGVVKLDTGHVFLTACHHDPVQQILIRACAIDRLVQATSEIFRYALIYLI